MCTLDSKQATHSDIEKHENPSMMTHKKIYSSRKFILQQRSQPAFEWCLIIVAMFQCFVDAQKISRMNHFTLSFFAKGVTAFEGEKNV